MALYYENLDEAHEGINRHHQLRHQISYGIGELMHQVNRLYQPSPQDFKSFAHAANFC